MRRSCHALLTLGLTVRLANSSLRDLVLRWMRESGTQKTTKVWRSEGQWREYLWVVALGSNACSRNVLPWVSWIRVIFLTIPSLWITGHSPVTEITWYYTKCVCSSEVWSQQISILLLFVFIDRPNQDGHNLDVDSIVNNSMTHCDKIK